MGGEVCVRSILADLTLEDHEIENVVEIRSAGQHVKRITVVCIIRSYKLQSHLGKCFCFL